MILRISHFSISQVEMRHAGYDNRAGGLTQLTAVFTPVLTTDNPKRPEEILISTQLFNYKDKSYVFPKFDVLDLRYCLSTSRYVFLNYFSILTPLV